MRILIALDRSEYAEIVLEHGFDQAVRRDAEEVHVVTVVPTEVEMDRARVSAAALVDQVADDFGCADRAITIHVARGRAAYAIASLAQELGVDLLVIGRFHVPSEADTIVDLVATPTLVVGIAGHELEPQCPDCARVRRATDSQRLFCDRHLDDYLPDLAGRVPTAGHTSSRLW